jgi:nucleotidyltransferase AbiEii toxin of type IV toxin-antitoxin system
VLSEFAIERLLFRPGRSEYRKGLVLKGATLFRLGPGDEWRATWNLDLLGSGESEIKAVLARVPDEDGILFELDSIRGEQMPWQAMTQEQEP